VPEETIDIPGLPFFLHPNPCHLDQAKWLRRIAPRVVLKLFDVVLKLTNIHAQGERQHLLGRKALNTLALIFGEEDPK
jgi:hypothetical protein